MEKIEEFKKKLQCEKCHEPYSKNNQVWIHIKCQHHACDDCCQFYRSSGFDCPICKLSTEYIMAPFFEDVLITMKDYESSIVRNNESETALRDENSILKEKLFLLEAPKEDHQKCAECERTVNEQDMQLCATCHGLEFKDHEDVKKNALCSSCAIKKHMRQGHQTVDFFPYFSAYNFSSQSSKIESNLTEFKSARNLLNDTFTNFNAASINVSGNYDVLTDMARRSRNTKKQLEFFEKMEMFIDKSKSIHGEANSDMKNHTTKLEETLAEIKKWYESRMEDCVEESEIVKLPKSENFSEDFLDVDA